MKKLLSAALSLALALSCCAGFALGEEPLVPNEQTKTTQGDELSPAPPLDGEDPAGEPAPDTPLPVEEVVVGYNSKTHCYTADGNDVELAEGAVVSIATSAQWGWFADYVNNGGATAGRTWELTADIGTSDEPAVGKKETPFSGTLDGNEKTISGSQWTDGMGVFGKLSWATVKNLHVKGALFSIAGTYIGGIAGRAENSTIENCHVNSTISVNVTRDGIGGIVGIAESCEIRNCISTISITAIVSTGSAAGGIAGKATDTKIEGCVNKAAISSIGDTGGIAGSVSGGSVTDCTNEGTISGSGTYTGGIAGRADNGAIIEDCVNEAKVTGAGVTGGIAGLTSAASAVKNCENSGTVQGTVTGGIVGDAVDTNVSACGNTGEVIGGSHTGGILGTMQNGTLSESWNTGKVTNGNAAARTGGVVGQMKYSGTVSKCFNAGTFHTSGQATISVGGIAGELQGSAEKTSAITDCYYVGSVSGITVSGIVNAASNAAITRCYAVVPPSTPTSCGIAPSGMSNVTVSGCYYDGVRFPYPSGEGTRLDTGYLVSGRTTDLTGASGSGWSAWTFTPGAYPQLTCMLGNDAAEEAVTPRTPYLYGISRLYNGTPIQCGDTADAELYYHIPSGYTLGSCSLKKETAAGVWTAVETAVEPGTYQAVLKYDPAVSTTIKTQTWTFTIQAPAALTLNVSGGTITPAAPGVYLLPSGSGAWQLEGDETVYESGAPVYLEGGTPYQFTAVSEGGDQT